MNYKNNENIIVSMARDGYYVITNDGNIFKKKRIRGHKKSTDDAYKIHCGDCDDNLVRADRNIQSGYCQLRVMVDDCVLYAYSHRIVWVYFFGDIPAGMQVNHKNGVKDDNRISNLELVTATGNKLHARDSFGNWLGERNGMCKLNERQVLNIRNLHESGMKPSVLSFIYKISTGHINDIIARRMWKHI